MNYFHCVLKIQYRFNLSNACVLIVCAKSLRLRQLYLCQAWGGRGGVLGADGGAARSPTEAKAVVGNIGLAM